MHELFAALRDRAAGSPGTLALTDDRGTATYGELAKRIGGLAVALAKANAGTTIGLLGSNSIEWVVADLAVTITGRRLVPLPTFFSQEQIAHICRDARIDTVICARSDASRLIGLNVERMELGTGRHAPFPTYQGGATRIIYTSGTTGAPKGVIHGDRQTGHMITALTEAASATHRDRHFSALPFSLLLEQIAGLFVPLAAGASVYLSAQATDAALKGDIGPMLERLAQSAPTTSVLTPQLLAAWVSAREHEAAPPIPETLRFVAVGGAPVPTSLTARARALGIPAFQGYGLSECCSVVTLERPKHPYRGTAGKPIGGVSVRLDDGEIVVTGPSLMIGYLGGPPVGGEWRTGDAGVLDGHGNLTVTGRRDNIIVRPSGRNISPEWIEARILPDPAVADAVLAPQAPDGLVLLIVPSATGADGLNGTSDEDAAARFAASLKDLPDYAMPGRIVLVPSRCAATRQLIGPNGKLDRAAVKWLLASQSDTHAFRSISLKCLKDDVPA